MVEIIPVSPQANVEAVRRQLAQGHSDHVALALPEGWFELDNMARLRLVQRQAQIQKRHLALVTRHEATRKTAQQLGIPVFTEINDAQQRRWHMAQWPLVDPRHPDKGLPDAPHWRRTDIVVEHAHPQRHQARLTRIRNEESNRRPLPFYLRLTGYVAMGTLLVLVLGAFARYVLPAATVTVVPGRESFAVTVPLTADGTTTELDPINNILPARFIETTIEETGTIATTGSEQKASDRAVGQVSFNNLGNSPVNIPEGTIVSTSTGTPVSFRTTASVSLEGRIGARVTAPIEAISPGIAGNVRANTINEVQGALRFRVRVTNPGGTGGGGAQLVPVVTQTDMDNLLAQVQASIEAKAHATLQTQLEPGEWLPPESLQTYIVSQNFDKFIDAEGNELSLTLRMLVQGTAMSQTQTDEAMLAALRLNVPQQAMVVADTITTQREPGANAIGRRVEFTMTAQAQYVVPIDPDEVRRAIAGKDPEEALSLISSRWRLAQPPELYRDPDWIDTLPTFPSRIQVRVEYAGALAQP